MNYFCFISSVKKYIDAPINTYKIIWMNDVYYIFMIFRIYQLQCCIWKKNNIIYYLLQPTLVQTLRMQQLHLLGGDKTYWSYRNKLCQSLFSRVTLLPSIYTVHGIKKQERHVCYLLNWHRIKVNYRHRRIIYFGLSTKRFNYVLIPFLGWFIW